MASTEQRRLHRRRRCYHLMACGLILAAAPRVAVAGAEHCRPWGDDASQLSRSWCWRQATGYEYAAAGLLVAATFGGLRFLPAPRANWTRVNDFDDFWRDRFRLRSLDGRRNADQISDVLWYTLMAYPMVVDSAAVAWGYRRSPRVALQTFTINAFSLGLLGVTGTLLGYVGRERPNVQACDAVDSQCDSDGRVRSFPSGHVAFGVNGASLICLHHSQLKLYGGGWADAAACGSGIVMATANAAMRLMADRHYLTDVLAGAALGLVTGYVVPWLMFYRHRRGQVSSATNALLLPWGRHNAGGLAYLGAF